MGWISIFYFLLWLLGILLLLIFLILILPVSLEIKGAEGEYEVKIKLWFLDIEKIGKIFSSKGKKNHKKDEKVKKKGKKKRFDYKQVIKYLRLVLVNAGRLLRIVIEQMNFKRLDLKLCIGGEDASKVAVEYGEVCSIFYPLARAFIDINRPEKYNLSVVPAFASNGVRADMDICLKTRIINFLIILIKVLKVMRLGIK